VIFKHKSSKPYLIVKTTEEKEQLLKEKPLEQVLKKDSDSQPMLRYARAFKNAFEADSQNDNSSVGRRSESRMSVVSRQGDRQSKDDELKGRNVYQPRRHVVSKIG